MMIQNKILLALAVMAVIIVGTYAYQVLPGYWPKTAPAVPSGSLAPLTRTDDFVRGNIKATAAKTIIEFGDIECPYCAQIDPQVTALMTAHPEAKIVWKDCPLPNHPNAAMAAEAARCAGRQGKFWEYRDLLFSLSGELNSALYTSVATGLKLDTAQFVACLDNKEERSRVQSSFAECANAGVTDLPWFYINGKVFSGGNALTELSTELNTK